MKICFHLHLAHTLTLSNSSSAEDVYEQGCRLILTSGLVFVWIRHKTIGDRSANTQTDMQRNRYINEQDPEIRSTET